MGNSNIDDSIKTQNLTKEEEEKLKEQELSPGKIKSIKKSFSSIFRLLDKFIGIKTGKYGSLSLLEKKLEQAEGISIDVPVDYKVSGRSLTFNEKKIASDNTKYLEKFRYDTPGFYLKLPKEEIVIIDSNIAIINKILFNKYRNRSGVNTIKIDIPIKEAVKKKSINS